VEPATQDVQTLFTVIEQAVDAYLPAVHTVHAVQLAAFVVMLNVDPATQEGHTVFAKAVHTDDLYFPAVQTVQAVHTRFVVVEQAVD